MQRFFRAWQKNPAAIVKQIQKQLKELGFYDHTVNGQFGIKTHRSVYNFQEKAGLHVDGVVGPITWKAMGLEVPVPSELKVPDGRVDLYDTFGDPLESGYWKEYGAFCETPPEMDHCFVYEFAGKHGFWCNRFLIEKFQKVYVAIVRVGLTDEVKTFGGCYNVRKIRGGDKLSTHSWGIAVDLNVAENMMGHEPGMHPGVVKCFEDEDFTWGGNFSRKDGMHMQYCKNY